MISISRALIRQLRTVFRRAGIGKSPATNTVHFQSKSDALRIQSSSPNVAISYQLSGQFVASSFTVPIQLLAKAESKKDELVEFSIQPNDQVEVTWTEARIPQRELCSSQLDKWAIFPETPEIVVENGRDLLTALAHASDVAASDSVRFATDCLRLSGPRESIAATDGRQLLVQGKFHFPWKEDLLIPANRVFNSSEFPTNGIIQVGRTEDWVLFRIGPWSLWFNIQKERRFPRVEDLIQRPDNATATLSIDASDKSFLDDTLPQLPNDDVFHNPVTIDLNGHIALRAKPADKETTTELVLANSRYTGEPIRINTNRDFLRRAIRLGFSTLSIYGTSQPIQCHEENRTFLWSTLDPSGAFTPSADAVQIESQSRSAANSPASLPPQERNRITMIAKNNSSRKTKESQSSTAENPSQSPATNEPTTSPIACAIALRDSLQTTLTKTNDLIRVLKRQRQQSRIVQATLNSLRQLQEVEK